MHGHVNVRFKKKKVSYLWQREKEYIRKWYLLHTCNWILYDIVHLRQQCHKSKFFYFSVETFKGFEVL